MNYFNKEKDEMLIKLVRTKPVIYDSSHPQNRNLIAKYNEWKEISDVMNIPIADLQKRWKHFRDHYKKKTKLKSKKNTWRYMPMLDFLSEKSSERAQAANAVTRPAQHSIALDNLTDASSSLYSDFESLVAAPRSDTPVPGVSSELPNNVPVPSTSRATDVFNRAGPSTSPKSFFKKRKNDSDSTTGIRGSPDSVTARRYTRTMSGDTSNDNQTTSNSDDSFSSFRESMEYIETETNKEVRSGQSNKPSATHRYFEAVADLVSMLPPHLISDSKLKIHKSVYKIELECQNRVMPDSD